MPIFMKRGCTEFSIPYPKFKEIDESMKYDDDWSKFENKIDKNNNYKEKKISENTLNGTSISDVLIMRNWLIFAKKLMIAVIRNLILTYLKLTILIKN